MKFEVTLDETKEKEIFEVIDKRLDGMKSNISTRTKKKLIQAIVQKALTKNPNVLGETLKDMGNGEFFDLIKDC